MKRPDEQQSLLTATEQKLATLPIRTRERLLQLAELRNLRSKGASLPAITRAQREERIPLSYAQQRLWFLAQMEGASGAYHMPFARRLRGDLDRTALRRALDRLVARHESLRTRFVAVAGEPEQRIAAEEESGFHLQEHDLQQHEEAQLELEGVIVEEARTKFDLEAGRLIRGRLIRMGEQEHVLLITMHHIVSDGWSMGVLFKELSVLYGAYRRGEQDPLPELAVQYADYAVWQRRWMEGEAFQEQAEYWRKNLAGVPELLEVATDHPRPAQQDYTGAKESLAFNEQLSAGVKELSQRQGTTLYMTLLAGWAALLGRLSGQEEVVIGTPVANRGHVEIEGLIGFFVNTLVIRVDLSGRPTVSALLGRVKEQVIAAQQHQEIPFAQVVEIVRPVRSLSHSPVFQVMFAWQNAPRDRFELAGITVGPLGRAPHVVAKFDLTLALQEAGERVVGGVEYATALYERGTIDRYLRYFRRLLEGMVAGGESQVVDSLSLLGEAERAQVLYEWNETTAEFPGDRYVHRMFEEQATRTPDVMAVVFEDAFLSYAELNRRANQLAHYLRYLGVKPDTRVAIYLERGLEMIVALLAVLKAGGAYVPLDPAWPVERLRFMLGDSVPVALVTYGHLETLLSGISDSVPVLDLKAGTAAWQEQPATNPDTAAVGLTLSHLAYVIYTSGSTGTPKGIMVQHSALANFLCSMQHNPGIKPADVLVAVTTFAFDIAALEFYLPLTMGARLVILSRDATVDGARLLRELQGGVSMMQATPASWRMLLDAGWKGTTGLKVLCGGEALDDGLAQSLIARGSSVWNMYGPTETTIWSLMKGLSGVEDKVSIGRPIANTRVYILDNHGQLVPVGVAGELYIGGAGVVRGYLNRPELTAERFLKDPFAADADARMYRTGDLCRWLADGNIEFLGRNDFQVKIRGFRIELGEIEARLAKYPGVREAVVAAREDDPGDKRLVAYYTTVTSGEEQTGEKQQEVVDRERLRSHLSATLPEYMVPAAYVHVNAFPLLPNGKLDRKALPVPAGDAYAVQGYEAPQGEIENQLAAIWAELLKLDRVGRHDNFFSLGGHSLLAVTLIERMRRHSFSVDVRTLFVTPTLAQLAATISTKARSVNIPDNLIPAACQAITPEMLPLVELTREEIAGIVSMVGGGAGNIQDIYPLVPLQEGILFHYQMGGGEGDPYLLASQMSFDSRSRLDRYLGAMQRVVERHDILRTAVLWEGLAEPVQVVWRQAVLPVEEVELDAAAGDVAQQLYARFDPRHFRIDVRQAPLLRFYVAHDASADRWLLMMLLHHLVGDHTSLERMMGEVQRYLLGQEASLPAPLPFRQLVAQARLGVSREEHEVFFRQMLGDVEEATAPFGLREVHGDGRGIEQGRLVVNEDLARRLRVQARKLGVSVASLCHLAWGRVLGKVSGREDVVFGTVLFGRMQGWEGVDRVMGLFINTLPVRLRVGDEGVETAVRSTQVLLAGLMCHEHASLAVAQRCSAVPAPVPLFSALLNYRNLAGAAQALPSPARQAWEGIRFLRSEERTNYPLTFSVNDLGGGLTLEAQVAGSVGPLRICAYMNTALESLVEALETSPARAVSSLEVLPEPERHQLLYEWNDTGREFPIGKCVHELFEEQVERTPEAVAVVHEDQQLSYGELNRRSNQLAHYLRQLGVKPDMRVAICLDRGLEMTVALLGVLKAGGAYVPLDPGYPAERLRFMLQDSAPAVLLTQGHLERLFLELKGALQVIDLGTEAGQWTDESNTNPDRARAGLASRHLAYIIYTSGSTGTPKGVSIEHRSAVNFIQWAQVSFSGDSLEHTLFSTSLNFDLAVYEWLVPITAGCTVRIVPSVLELAQTKLDVTLINTVPSAMKSLMEMDGVPQTVRTVNLAGEPLKRALVERIFATTEVSTVCNLYGPSETTTYSTWVCMGRGDGFAAHIGRPIANTRVYILDAQLEPVPVGVAGELYIGGAGVARGYQRRAEQTAERFVPEPYGEEAGGRMYRTGDVGRWLEDGTIEFLGRNDDQVKIRGFRVELGEIEARLMEHSGVREAVVIMGEATAGDKRLVAYYTAVEEETRLSAEVLRPYLSARLPEYMIPAAYVRMEKLPLTPNGKLDRRALASVEELAQRGGERKYEGPRTAVEEILCGIWEEVLNVERVGVCHNFFELGGHSLLATRVVSRVRETLFVTVSVRNLFEAPTIREFSQRVLEREVQQGQTEKIAIIFKQVQLLDAQ